MSETALDLYKNLLQKSLNFYRRNFSKYIFVYLFIILKSVLGNTSIEKNCNQELKVILEHVDRLFAEINKNSTEEIACLTKKLSESDLCAQKHSVTIEKLELQLKSYQSELLNAEEKHKQSKDSHEHEIKVLKEEFEALKETNEVLESRISDTGVKNLIQQNNVDKEISNFEILYKKKHSCSI